MTANGSWSAQGSRSAFDRFLAQTACSWDRPRRGAQGRKPKFKLTHEQAARRADRMDAKKPGERTVTPSKRGREGASLEPGQTPGYRELPSRSPPGETHKRREAPIRITP